MGDIIRGKYFDTNGVGSKHFHWDKILQVFAAAIAVIGGVLGFIGCGYSKVFMAQSEMGGYMWMALFLVGVMVIALFLWFVFWKEAQFNTPLLGLLSLGLGFVAIGIIQPDSIRYGEFELKKAKQEAEDATKLAYEATALLIWNDGRFGAGLKNQEQIATRLLQHVYGDEALPYRHFLQQKGFFLTPKEDLKKIPNGKPPQKMESPFYNKYLKDSYREGIK